MTSARDELLARVRAALTSVPEAPMVPRDYHGAGEADVADVVERFAERVADYAATVHRIPAEELPALVTRLTAGERVVASGGVMHAGAFRGDDPSLAAAALDRFDAAVTGCFLAIAETGTIVLDGGPESGRRALTLIPDHHLCVVRAEQVVAGVPDAVAALHDVVREGRPLTFVSGPSATSDIELERIEGVHGPRRLDVVLVDVSLP